MKGNFAPAVRELYRHEGGYSDNPNDPGGPTMRGITKKRLEQHYGRPVSTDELKALAEEVSDHIYKTGYWDKVRGDELPAGVDYAVFDMAVNSGPYAAIKALQKVLKVRIDYVVGPKTLEACRKANAVSLIGSFNAERMKLLVGLPTWPTFRNGWTRRVLEVTQTATLMAEGKYPPG